MKKKRFPRCKQIAYLECVHVKQELQIAGGRGSVFEVVVSSTECESCAGEKNQLAELSVNKLQIQHFHSALVVPDPLLQGYFASYPRTRGVRACETLRIRLAQDDGHAVRYSHSAK